MTSFRFRLSSGTGRGVVASLPSLRRYGMKTNPIPGAAPLHYAAIQNDTRLVSLLVSDGEDINAQCDWGFTPLIYSCNCGNLEASRLLVELGADTTICNREGYSAYMRVPGNCHELIALMRDVTPADEQQT